MEVFLKDNVSEEEIATVWKCIVTLLHGAKPEDTSLSKSRYTTFVRYSKIQRFSCCFYL